MTWSPLAAVLQLGIEKFAREGVYEYVQMSVTDWCSDLFCF
jgi:hypothetical protein